MWFRGVRQAGALHDGDYGCTLGFKGRLRMQERGVRRGLGIVRRGWWRPASVVQQVEHARMDYWRWDGWIDASYQIPGCFFSNQ